MTPAVASFGPLTEGTMTSRPLLIVAALILASFVVGFDTRVFSVGLADIRGAFGLSFDEGSWLSTAASAPQIVIASAVAWLVTVFGIRRIMIPTCAVYTVISLFIPFVHNAGLLIVLHMFRALLLGIFIPATIMIIFRSLQPRYWLVGLAFYALRIPFSQSLGFVLVGVYGDDLGWQWLYWQDVIVVPLIALLLLVGAPKEPIDVALLKAADWGGMLLLVSSMTMIYIALDQGNRLDWFQSGIIVSFLSAGITLAIGFFINESLVGKPWAHASVILSRNLGLGFAVILCFTFGTAGSSILIPAFLQTVAGLRPVEIGSLYLDYAVFPVPLFIIAATVLLRFLDARYAMIAGLVAMACASLLATHITSAWAPANFALIVLLQTFGQAFTFLSTVVYLISNSDPKRATATSAYIQVIRLGSVELVGSLLNTWIRQREQFHSNILGNHVSSTLPALNATISKLEHAFGVSSAARADALAGIGSMTRIQANVLAYSDGFTISFWFAVAGLLMVAFMRKAPRGPLSPV
jgi:DHA2 family multidrug resistance protein